MEDNTQAEPQPEAAEIDPLRIEPLTDPVPWDQPVNGEPLLNAITGAYSRYLSLIDGAAEALALWTLFAYVHNSFDISPLLSLLSPVKRCGKTTALKILFALTPKPLIASHTTPASIFRFISLYEPTLMFDEFDTYGNDAKALRGMINSGHSAEGAIVIRADLITYSTWAPKVVAAIGSLPPTIADRSISIPMRRKAPDEQRVKLQTDLMGRTLMMVLRRQAKRWAEDNGSFLDASSTEVPESITGDRAQDNWLPLLTIADSIGGEWPERARWAATRLSLYHLIDVDAAEQLLTDLRDLFDKRKAQRLPTVQILHWLNGRDDRDWAVWCNGKPLNRESLAGLLRPFGIFPAKWRDGGRTTRGYLRANLADAFRRYPPPKPGWNEAGFNPNATSAEASNISMLSEGGVNPS